MQRTQSERKWWKERCDDLPQQKKADALRDGERDVHERKGRHELALAHQEGYGSPLRRVEEDADDGGEEEEAIERPQVGTVIEEREHDQQHSRHAQHATYP